MATYQVKGESYEFPDSYDDAKVHQVLSSKGIIPPPGPPAGQKPALPAPQIQPLGPALQSQAKDFITSPHGYIREGARQIGQGATELGTPGQRMRGATDILKGGASMAAPVGMGALIPAAVAAPAATAAGIGLGAAGAGIGGMAGRAGVRAMGGGPDAEELGGTVGELAGGAAGGLGGSKVPEMIPSKVRAGQNLNAVSAKIGPDTPVDVSRAYPAITRAQELSDTGAAAPKIVGQFRDRMNAPGAGPITYRESRDFASNAGNLAASEKMGTNKMMGAQVKMLAKALDEGNEALADQHGVGDQYRAAMKEYRRASQVSNIADFAKQHAGKMALGAAGLGGAYPLYKKLKGE